MKRNEQYVFCLEGPTYESLKDSGYSPETIKAFEKDMIKKTELKAEGFIVERRAKDLAGMYFYTIFYFRTKKSIRRELFRLTDRLNGIYEEIRVIDDCWKEHEKLKEAYSICVRTFSKSERI